MQTLPIHRSVAGVCRRTLACTARRLRGERAQALPLFAVGLVGMMGIVGLSVDIGRVAWAMTDAQKAADAAALAGAIDLPTEATAKTTANSYLTKNGGSTCQPSCATVTNSASEITVTATKHVDYFFLRFVGLSGRDVTRTARVTSIGVTGLSFTNPAVFPYAVWGGNPSYPNCSVAYGLCPGASKTYRANNWDNQVAQSEKNNGNWTVPGNNFKGYFNTGQSGQVYQADPYQQYSFGGNAIGQGPTDKLHEYYVSGTPIVIPVITKGTCTSNCGTLHFTIIAWVALKLTVDPTTTGADWKGTVVASYSVPGGVGGGYTPGGNVPMVRTISLAE
jgi:hypothetical protein